MDRINAGINDKVGNTAAANVAKEHASNPVKWSIGYRLDGDTVIATVKFSKNETTDIEPESHFMNFRFPKKEIYSHLSYEVDYNVLKNIWFEGLRANGVDQEVAELLAKAEAKAEAEENRGTCRILNDKDLVFANRVAAANRDERVKSVNQKLKEEFKEIKKESNRKKYELALEYFEGPIKPQLYAAALYESFIFLLKVYNYWQDAKKEIATVMAAS